ncbi:unnamed protein product [Trifolium pratense]|uniref:Uncharacterized protein n=1 Tax=Trifolium pratense TaxID=57577 RepID=A0ACB0IXT8_TRIPR|nr:unnamed protein product [Trifolium pratense]
MFSAKYYYEYYSFCKLAFPMRIRSRLIMMLQWLNLWAHSGADPEILTTGGMVN